MDKNLGLVGEFVLASSQIGDGNEDLRDKLEMGIWDIDWHL